MDVIILYNSKLTENTVDFSEYFRNTKNRMINIIIDHPIG